MANSTISLRFSASAYATVSGATLIRSFRHLGTLLPYLGHSVTPCGFSAYSRCARRLCGDTPISGQFGRDRGLRQIAEHGWLIATARFSLTIDRPAEREEVDAASYGLSIGSRSIPSDGPAGIRRRPLETTPSDVVEREETRR